MNPTTTTSSKPHANFRLSEKDTIHSNTYLSIAWHAATVGLNASYSRLKKKVNRTRILTYDIPKLCEMLCINAEDMEGEHQQQQLKSLPLGTKAKLLYGVARIIRYQSQYLYEDSITLSNKLKHVLTKSDKDGSCVNMDKPFANVNAITLVDNDDLLEYLSATNAPAFSYLFNDRYLRPNERDNTLNELEESICSILQMAERSTTLGALDSTMGVGSVFTGYFGQQSSASGVNAALMQTHVTASGGRNGNTFGDGARNTDTPVLPKSLRANDRYFEIDNGTDYDDPFEPYKNAPLFEDLVDYGDGCDDIDTDSMAAAMARYSALNPEQRDHQQQVDGGVHGTSTNAGTALQNDIHRSANTANPFIATNSSGSTLSAPSHQSYTNTGGGGLLNLPSLIPEEEDDVNSVSTAQYSAILPLETSIDEGNDILTSLIPPTRRRPRLIRRMMMAREEDTMFVPFLEDTSSITLVDNSNNGYTMIATTASCDERMRMEQRRHKLLIPLSMLWSSGGIANKNLELRKRGDSTGNAPYLAKTTTTTTAGVGTVGRHEFSSLFYRRTTSTDSRKRFTNEQLGMEAGRDAETSRRYDYRRERHHYNPIYNSNSSNNSSDQLSLRSHSGLHTPDVQNHLGSFGSGGGSDSADEVRQRDRLYWQQRFHFEDDGYDIIENNNMNNHDASDADPGPLFDFDLGDGDDEVVAAAEEEGEDNNADLSSSDLYRMIMGLVPTAEYTTSEMLFQNKPRSEVASKFYHLLGLASKSRIRVHQREPYGSIDVTVMPLSSYI